VLLGVKLIPADHEQGGQRRRRPKSIDELTIGNWTRRGVVVVDEISRQIDTSATDRFFVSKASQIYGLWLMSVGVDKHK